MKPFTSICSNQVVLCSQKRKRKNNSTLTGTPLFPGSPGTPCSPWKPIGPSFPGSPLPPTSPCGPVTPLGPSSPRFPGYNQQQLSVKSLIMFAKTN